MNKPRQILYPDLVLAQTVPDSLRFYQAPVSSPRMVFAV